MTSDSPVATSLILVLDEGTTSTRAIVFDLHGNIIAVAARPITQHYPHSGWVEQDAAEIWALTLDCLREAAATVGVDHITAIGITNQRETVVAWDRLTGEPLAPAIVWQDRRTADRCSTLRGQGFEAEVQAKTGLLLDPYFSATKFEWMIEHCPAVATAAQQGRLALGTVDAWLLYKLTGGGVHSTDATNAGRTLLMELRRCEWHAGLATRFGVPLAALPRIIDGAGPRGSTTLLGREVPITASVGDQHAAAIGQGCLRRDGIGLIETAAASEGLARSVPDTGGVVVVPAFAGMGAPHWRSDVRGIVTGLTAATTRAHLVRATLAAMAHQTADLLTALAADGVTPTVLRIDGGMVANDWLCQHLADILDLPVERPRVIETTALGCAMLAALGAGLFPTLDAAVAAMRQPGERFEPAMDAPARDADTAAWDHAVRQSLTV